MAEEEYDEFAGGSGLKDDYDGTIIDSWFAVNPQADNKLCAYLKVLADDGEEVENRYSCGPDWGSYDGGDTAEHPKGEKHPFNNQTAYFIFTAAAIEAGAEEVLRQRSREQFNRKGPKAAGIWKGMRFHWEVDSKEITLRTGEQKGEKITVNRILPTKFLGMVDVASGGSGGGGGATPTTAPSPTVPATGGGDVLSTLDPAVVAQMKLQAGVKNYGEFVDWVLTNPDLVSNNGLMTALGDEGFYNSLKG